jgi:hypothetical protein
MVLENAINSPEIYPEPEFDDLTSWRELLTKEMSVHGESFTDIEFSTLTDKQLDNRFCDGLGEYEDTPFTVWTKNRVYFPACYDGSSWVASVSRNPDGKPTEHIGD